MKSTRKLKKKKKKKENVRINKDNLQIPYLAYKEIQNCRLQLFGFRDATNKILQLKIKLFLALP